jgi:hypothetical protein
MTVVQLTQSPAATAFRRLLAADDALPADRRAVVLLDRPTALVVIVDTPLAWGVWVDAVHLAAQSPTVFHRGEHLTVAENVVDGWPVQVIKTPPYPTERPVCAA